MTKKEAQALIQRYVDGTCSTEERLWVEQWLNEQFDQSDAMSSADLDAIGELIAKRLPVNRKRKINRAWFIAAAIVGIATSLGVGFYLHQENMVVESKQIVQDIAPGGDQAYLTLNTGEIIPLTGGNRDSLSAQTGVLISESAEGELVYTVTEDASKPADPLAYNSVSTPKGGQFRIQLPDGTKVWLNAASSITYPTSFSAVSERKVTLKGEAYFEVARDVDKPFIVHTDPQNGGTGQEVYVLGTKFNINSYADEDEVTTTLVDGAVRVEAAGKQVLLKPNQQARLKPAGLSVIDVSAEEALAWKNGYFMFDNEGIESIMRKIARWYDVEVVFEEIDSKQVFSGTVSKFSNVSTVLNILELTGGVQFEVEERRIIVK